MSPRKRKRWELQWFRDSAMPKPPPQGWKKQVSALALRPPPRQAPSEECGGLRRERRNTSKGGKWLLYISPH